MSTNRASRALALTRACLPGIEAGWQGVGWPGVGWQGVGWPGLGRLAVGFFGVGWLGFLLGCSQAPAEKPATSATASASASSPASASAEAFPVKIEPRWAELFKVSYRPGLAEIEIRAPWQNLGGAELRYRLRRRGSPAPPAEKGVRDFEVPLLSVATTSTTELPALVALGAQQSWVGHSELDFVSAPSLRARIAAGKVREIGSPADLETLLTLRPEALFADFLSRPELDRLAVVEQAGCQVLVVPSFLEKSPLGRAEWVLLLAMFLGKEREATAFFGGVEQRYLALRDRVAAETRDRPRVFTGGPYQSTWHVPGGRSFAARLIADAGATYVWHDDPSSGALPLDLEKVFEQAHDADFWLYPSHWRSLREIAAVDPRLALFRAWQRGAVIAGDLRLSPSGGNDFWEEGAARPDLVLADLVAVFHPGLLPDHPSHFHRRLTETLPETLPETPPSAGSPEAKP